MNFYANILESKQPVIGDPYFLQTKEEIKKWLNEMEITKYTDYIINDDLTVDIDGNVELQYRNLKKIPIKFNKVKGFFSCSRNILTSLKGSPKIISGIFYCSGNKLFSLEHCTEEVETIDATNNRLSSLKYLPNVKNYIYIKGNQLNDLKGLKNITPKLLIELITHYPELDWKEIEWNNVNIDNMLKYFYENVKNIFCQKALLRIEELQLY